MKGIKSCYNLISTIIITAILLTMLATTSFAWFKIKDSSNISFTAGSSNVELYSATFQGDTESGEYVWVKEGKLETEDIFGSEYTLGYVTQLGTIDNLAFRTELNNVWYCLKVNKATATKFSLRLCLADESSFKMFTDLDNTYSEVVAGGGQSANVAINKVNELLEKLIYTDSLIVTSVKTENFFDEVTIPNPDESFENDSPLNVCKYSNNGAMSFIGNTILDSDYFYIYFRTYPNLDAYTDLVDYISEFMPCVLQFNLKISLIIDNNI